MKSNNPLSHSLNFFFFLIKWRKPLIIVGALSILLSILFSGPWFIKPKFKSEVVFFPTVTNSVSKALLGGGPKQDLLEFGAEERAEQLLQLLNSDEIRNRIIRKYHLMEHYDIDSTDDYPMTKLMKMYHGNIKFERTEYMSVRVEVMDTDPQQAADMANDISALLDSVKNRMQHDRAVEALRIVEREYKIKKDRVEHLEDSLTQVRENGVFEYKSQSKALQEEYLKSSSLLALAKAEVNGLGKGDSREAQMAESKVKSLSNRVIELKSQLTQFSKLGGAYNSLTEILKIERENLGILRENLENAKVDATEKMSHKFIVNNAFKAEKKSYPTRSLIVLISLVSSLLLCIMVILFIENYQYFRSLKEEGSEQ